MSTSVSVSFILPGYPENYSDNFRYLLVVLLRAQRGSGYHLQLYNWYALRRFPMSECCWLMNSHYYKEEDESDIACRCSRSLLTIRCQPCWRVLLSITVNITSSTAQCEIFSEVLCNSETRQLAFCMDSLILKLLPGKVALGAEYALYGSCKYNVDGPQIIAHEAVLIIFARSPSWAASEKTRIA